MAVAANFFDTNILIYTVTQDRRADQARELFEFPFVVSVQTLNEFVNVARRKLKMPWQDITEAIEVIIGSARLILTINENTTLAAIEFAQRYNFSFYDAAMVSTAVKAGCTRYYSEDLHHGLVVERQMTIVNPFR